MELLENSVSDKKVQPVNLKKEIGKYLRKWPWFLLSMLVFYTAAKIYLRYAEPQYFTKTSLKLQESKSKNSAALSDLKNFETVNNIFKEFFTEPYPSRTAFEVSKLPSDSLVEIEAIAYLEK